MPRNRLCLPQFSSLLIIALLKVWFHPVAASADFAIAQNGQAGCIIVRQTGATATEVNAANELATTLKQITGASFESNETSLVPRQKAIVVGPGPVAHALFPEVPFERLGGEDVVIKSRGNYLLLAGGRPRGTLYAVTEFLQQPCGVRWWTPWATDIPHQANLRVPDLNIQEKPQFEYREPYWVSAFDKNWAIHNFYNGDYAPVPDDLGGHITYASFVHTFYKLVPPDQYFQAHPEWYSLINGQRTAQGAQLCLTNQQLRDFVVAQVRALLKASPATNIISISQNDAYGPCQCDNCKALDDAEGSPAGNIIDFVNYIADKLGPEFPNVAFDTIAYQYSRHPPKNIKPRPNVIVRLCSIDCNFAAPLDDPSNADFANDIQGWSKICNRLYIWDYVTNFDHFAQPHPNWFVLGPNVRLFRDNHVRGVFEQGDDQSNGAEMAELRAWVLAQLLWNPDANDDALINEFLNGYYGTKAAPFIRRYLDLLHDNSRDYFLRITAPPDAPFLSFAILSQAEQLWQQAEAATQNDSVKLWRVRQGHLPVRYVWLTRWTQLRADAVRANATWPLPASRNAVANEWLAAATDPGPEGWTEMTDVDKSHTTVESFVADYASDPPN